MRTSQVISLTAGGLVFAWVCFAQAFDVASIRENRSGSADSNVDSTPGGLFRLTNVSLFESIKLGFRFEAYRIIGAPAWADATRYDIVLKSESSSPVKKLLEDRFALKSHTERKESLVYTLTQAKGGSKLTRHDDGTGTRARDTCGRLVGRRVTSEVLALMISRQLEHVVLNQTGLEGKYDFDLDWTPDAGPCRDRVATKDAPSIFTAIQQQLGLKLTAGKGPVDFLVIDHVEPPSENQLPTELGSGRIFSSESCR